MPRVISDLLFAKMLSVVGRYELELVADVYADVIEVEETTGTYVTTGDDPVLNRTWEEL